MKPAVGAPMNSKPPAVFTEPLLQPSAHWRRHSETIGRHVERRENAAARRAHLPNEPPR